MIVRPLGPGAVVVEVPDAGSAARLAARLRAVAPEVGLRPVDVVPAARTVLVDGVGEADAHRLLAAVRASGPDPLADDGPGARCEVEVAVRWDGPDLDDVARRWGCGVETVVDRLCGTDLVAAFCGFAPGFAYLAGLPDELAVPRLDTPRPRVAAGSVALADAWCGIYPSASPGGWRVVGHTDAVLFDVTRDEPALLAPGTRVRLVRA